METTDLTSEQLTTPSKYKGLGSAMAAGFWFGVILVIRMVDSLDYCVEAIMNSK